MPIAIILRYGRVLWQLTAPENGGTFNFTNTACVGGSMRRTAFMVAINSNCCLDLVLVYACSSSECNYMLDTRAIATKIVDEQMELWK